MTDSSKILIRLGKAPENIEPIRMLRYATLRRRPHRSYLAQESGGSWVRLYRTNTGQKNRCINAGGVQQAHGISSSGGTAQSASGHVPTLEEDTTAIAIGDFRIPALRNALRRSS